jgi:hypothetical protein
MPHILLVMLHPTFRGLRLLTTALDAIVVKAGMMF